HVRDPLHRPVRLRPADGPLLECAPLTVAAPGRPRQLALRPARPRTRSLRRRRRPSPRSPGGPPMNRIWLTLLLLPGILSGCSDQKPPPASPIDLDPAVKVVHARYRTVKRTVEQPGVISSYERTALYAKVAGFVDKWHVDIGDRVTKDATVVRLRAPELV